jgi:hypothetical protein
MSHWMAAWFNEPASVAAARRDGGGMLDVKRSVPVQVQAIAGVHYTLQ